MNQPPAAPAPAPLPARASAPAPARGSAPGVFVPLLLGLIALVGVLLMQTVLLSLERGGLQTAHGSQQQTVDNAAKLRASLDGLAADTQRLADSGNANAGLLVAELRKRGITINPNPAGAASAPR